MSDDDLNNSKDGLTLNSNIQAVRIIDDEIDSRELFQSARELRIRHDGGVYRLRLTSLNKLILTK
jgi:hemin uptake protein HemP